MDTGYERSVAVGTEKSASRFLKFNKKIQWGIPLAFPSVQAAWLQINKSNQENANWNKFRKESDFAIFQLDGNCLQACGTKIKIF